MPLPGYEWVNNAKNGGSPYAGPDYYPYPPSILLHMTVSMGISASYISGHAYPPHCWANPYDGRLYQTVELDRAAYALYQPSYGYHWVNKKAYCLQTECVGVPVVSTPTWSDAHLRWLAEHVVVPQERWLRDRGMTANIGNFRYHTNTSGSASEDWGGRMGEQEWADFNGLYCHIDAWGNDHWDCSAERIDLISRYALEILGGGGPPPPPKELFPVGQYEDIMFRLDLLLKETKKCRMIEAKGRWWMTDFVGVVPLETPDAVMAAQNLGYLNNSVDAGGAPIPQGCPDYLFDSLIRYDQLNDLIDAQRKG
jgi:hypothetical protein